MEEVINTRQLLLTKSPFELMISLSLPAMIGMIVVGLYSFMDAIFVGQMIGSSAMTAVSVAYPFTFINNGVAVLLGIGSASILSRAIGRNDQVTIDKIMGNMIILVFIFSMINTVFGTFFSEQFLILSGAKGEVLSSGIKYLQIIFLGSVFVNFAQSANMIMRGEGVLKKAMIIMGIGALLNIILDPIMISIFKNYDMGVEGAAIATVISQIIQAIITLNYFRKKSPIVKIKKIRIETSILPEIFAIGLSATLMQVLTMVQQVVMYNTAAQYGGSSWQTFLSASLRIQSFAFIPLWGMAQGFQPVVGTNFGAGEYDRVKKITKVFMLSGTILAGLFFTLIQLVPELLLSLFIKEPEIVALGISDFRIMFSVFFLFAFMVLSITLFQSLGKASIAGIITIARQIFVFIPLVILLPKIANLGIRGVFIAPMLTDIIISIFCFIMIRKSLKNLCIEK